MNRTRPTGQLIPRPAAGFALMSSWRTPWRLGFVCGGRVLSTCSRSLQQGLFCESDERRTSCRRRSARIPSSRENELSDLEPRVEGSGCGDPSARALLDGMRGRRRWTWLNGARSATTSKILLRGWPLTVSRLGGAASRCVRMPPRTRGSRRESALGPGRLFAKEWCPDGLFSSASRCYAAATLVWAPRNCPDPVWSRLNSVLQVLEAVILWAPNLTGHMGRDLWRLRSVPRKPAPSFAGTSLTTGCCI